MNIQYAAIIVVLALINFPFVLVVNWHVHREGVKRVYNVPIEDSQLAREMHNAMTTTPVHALLLAAFLWTGLLRPGAESISAALITFVITFVWTEVWHYASHIAMHTRPLHFIHKEHHRSMATGPWTSVSFSFLEKFIFSFGIIGFMSLLSRVMPISVYGIAAYYVFYFFTNTLGHANFEFRKPGYYQSLMGKFFNSPSFHAMHHARYINNFGLITPVLDKLFGTAWEDFREVQTLSASGQPLSRLGERVKISSADGAQQHA